MRIFVSSAPKEFAKERKALGEYLGTGIRDLIRRCRDAGLPEPAIRLDGGSFVLTIRRRITAAGIPSRPSHRTCDRFSHRTSPSAIVHELLHLVVPNHGKLWQSLMRAQLGDYEQLEQRLRAAS